MLRQLGFSLAALFALAGCVTDASYPTAPVAPPQPNLYTGAAIGPVHAELISCNRWGSNLGEIGARGEVALFRPYIYTSAGPLLRMPVESACLSSGFGWRGGDSGGGGRPHNGVDLANPRGGFVYAAAAGRVREAGWRGGYGYTLELDHGAGVTTIYAHLAEIDPNLRRGARVEAGQAVARMGMTGNATGVHLHYEVMVGPLLVDPLQYGLEPPPVT